MHICVCTTGFANRSSGEGNPAEDADNKRRVGSEKHLR